MMRFQRFLLALAVMLLFAGCASTRHRHCLPCEKYWANPDTAACPFEPVVQPTAGPYRNLVFQGGGVKGTAYAGSLAVMAGSGLLSQIDQVAGTSAGALTALLVSLGYTAEEIHELVLAIDYEKFKDGSFPGDVRRLFDDYGWYKGDYALCLLECVVERKTGSKKTTFAELYAMKDDHPDFRDLYVFGTDVNRQASIPFSHQHHADVPLAEAARISMSIPFFFAAQELDQDIFVDGGVLRNYPITTFDKYDPPKETLGFHLGTEPPRETIDDLVSFIEGVFATLLDEQVAQFCSFQPQNVERSVFINTLGIGTTDFSIIPAQKCALIKSGRDATIAYLREETHADKCPQRLLLELIDQGFDDLDP